MGRRSLGVALGLLALLAAHPAAIHPWQRFDLLTHPPSLEREPHTAAGQPWRVVESMLGGAEVHGLTRGPHQQLLSFSRRVAGEVEALQQSPGSRLVWSVTLGAEPYLSTTPLEGGPGDSYRIAVRDSTGEAEIYRASAPPPSTFAPPAVEIDLSAWAGRPVDLVFEIRAGDGSRSTASWGSPAVYWRNSAPLVPPRAGPPNILLITVDTLRADVIGPRPGGPSATPEIDRLARQSDVYTDAFTAVNATNPSFASIFTGRYAKDHGVYNLTTPLAPGQATLTQALAAAGYDTLAVISAHHLGDRNSGLGRGFRTVVQADRQFAAELAVESAMGWLARAGAPFFAWVHLFDPHTSHTPPAPYSIGRRPATASGLGPVRAWLDFRSLGSREFDEPDLAGNRDLYLGEVAYVDRQVGRLIAYATSRGLLANTVVVFVADHGESLGEHGILYRHVGLYDTTTHVPLMIRWPGQRPGRTLRGLVQTLDLFPTLLRAAGLEPPADQDGRALGELFAEGRRGRTAVFAEHAEALGAMVRTSRHLYFESRGNGWIPDGRYLFDVARDPEELRNLAGEGRPEEPRLREALRAFLSQRRPLPGVARRRALSDEDRANLRALGYL